MKWLIVVFVLLGALAAFASFADLPAEQLARLAGYGGTVAIGAIVGLWLKTRKPGGGKRR